MIGAPVRRLARAAARWTFSTFSVTPGSSAAHLMNAALISVPWIPCSMSATNSSAIWSGVAADEERRQVVVGVDAGAGDDLEAGLLGDPAHELDVAAEEHRRRVADRLHAELDRGRRPPRSRRRSRRRRARARGSRRDAFACGHCSWTASSRVRRCSWISVVPSSSASIGPGDGLDRGHRRRQSMPMTRSGELHDRDHHRGDQAGDAGRSSCSANWRASRSPRDSMRRAIGSEGGRSCSSGSSSGPTAQRPPPRPCARRPSSPGRPGRSSTSSAPTSRSRGARLREESGEIPGDVAYAVGPEGGRQRDPRGRRRRRRRRPGSRSTTHAREGDPADAILDVAEEVKARA